MVKGGPGARVKSCGLISNADIGHAVNLQDVVRLGGDRGADHSGGGMAALGLESREGGGGNH